MDFYKLVCIEKLVDNDNLWDNLMDAENILDWLTVIEEELSEILGDLSLQNEKIKNDVIKLYLGLLMLEDAYIRFDDDRENEITRYHPRFHFDIFYTNGASFKLGVSGKPFLSGFIDLLSLKTEVSIFRNSLVIPENNILEIKGDEMYSIERIWDVTEKFFQEAKKCYENECHIASLILYGAILEALLLSMCFAYPEAVRKTRIYKRKKKKVKRKRGIFLEFTLNDLIEIAEELKWLPMGKQIEDLGEFRNWVKWLQMTRNLIHPALWLKPDPHFKSVHKIMKQASKKDYKKFVELSEETILGIKEILLGKITASLWHQINKNSS